MKYFEDNRDKYRNGGSWSFTATPGHGVHRPLRPTINFFVADTIFAASHEEAAKARGLKHGILIRRSAIERVADGDEFQLADVKVGHPLSYGQTDPREYWRFDLGNHRFASVAALRYATVVRLATPEGDLRREVSIPRDAIVAWW
ncbi:hypothetical protein [Polyangium jinanense]|uniref:Uncharacterized protein n=1 Tax=Polyangium jinanense TaxID=2829994 RepID=A0A9X4AUE2_9BACT|nr:hypothetical protein [Polyangium jinanense]MDC3960684.1 hypothetical protein [Polyangium jinanense]MDC3984516.1 hypothetical protein [Polyangium jinanense]